MATGPSPVDRRQYGDMADDVCLLRSDGRIVARFKDGFRVDSNPEIFSAAQVRGMATVVRARREQAKERLIARRPKPKPAPDTPACESVAANEAQAGGALVGNSKSRSPVVEASDSSVEPVVPIRKDGNAGERGTTDCPCGRRKGHGGRCWFMRGWPGPVVPLARGKHAAGICDVCKGPRSYWARHVCRKCQRAKAAKPKTDAERIDALEARQAAFEAIVRAAVAELVAHLGMGQGR